MKPVPHGEPYAGKLHVRFDEGAGVPDNKGRSALLYTPLYLVPHGEPYAGKLHVRFDEGAGVPDNKGRPALLYTP